MKTGRICSHFYRNFFTSQEMAYCPHPDISKRCPGEKFRPILSLNHGKSFS